MDVARVSANTAAVIVKCIAAAVAVAAMTVMSDVTEVAVPAFAALRLSMIM